MNARIWVLVRGIGDVGSGIALRAPISGIIRGLTHKGVSVTLRTKVVEVDSRGDRAAAFGLGARPRCIAEGVLRAMARVPVRA